MPQVTGGAEPLGGGSFLVALRLAGRRVLVVGGGEVAASRTFFALDADALVTVVCPTDELTSEELRARVEARTVTWLARPFETTDLDGIAVVLSATTDVPLGQKIATLCQERKLLCNIADVPKLCDFWLMSQHRDGDLQIAVSTNGNGPKLANRLRRHIQTTLPPNAGGAITRVGELRQRVRTADPAAENMARRMRWLSELCDGCPLGVLANLTDDQMNKLVQLYLSETSSKAMCPVPHISNQVQSKSSSLPSPSSSSFLLTVALPVLNTITSPLIAIARVISFVLFLIGFKRTQSPTATTPSSSTSASLTSASSSSTSLLPSSSSSTITTTLQTSQVEPASASLDSELPSNTNASSVGRIALVGAGPGDPDLLTRKAYRLLQEADIVIADKLLPHAMLDLVKAKLHIAKKFKGKADEAQDETNDVALAALREGKNVVRLKGGDPFVFGRGGEEILFFRKHGFEPIVVPGVSSALAAPSSALIPLTHRGVSDQVLICTGHDRKGQLPNMPSYSPKRTCVFLMATDRLGDLGAILMAQGFPADCPAAVIERATWPEQRHFKGTITTLGDVITAEQVTSPATIVVGNSVNALETS